MDDQNLVILSGRLAGPVDWVSYTPGTASRATFLLSVRYQCDKNRKETVVVPVGYWYPDEAQRDALMRADVGDRLMVTAHIERLFSSHENMRRSALVVEATRIQHSPSTQGGTRA